MTKAKEGAPPKSIKKTHVGLIGLITILLQYGVGRQTEDQTNRGLEKVMNAQMRAHTAEMHALLEREFVRKGDLSKTLNRIDRKLDQVDSISSKVSRIEGYLRARKIDLLTSSP